MALVKKSKSSIKKENEVYIKIISNMIPDIDKKDLSNCLICLVQLTTKKLILLKDCHHYYCSDCVKQYIITNIYNGTTDIKCPNPKCHVLLTYRFITKLIDEKIIELYNNLLLDKCVTNSDDMIYCPKNGCGKICVKSCHSNRVNCPYCFNQYCYICIQSYKDGHRCKPGNFNKYIPKELAETLKGKNVKPCPKCKVILEKVGGCSTMQCKFCSTVFCWKCLKKDEDIKFNENHHKCHDYNGLDVVEYDDDSGDSYESDYDSSSSDR
jgi:hypothetical protein